MKHGHCSYGLTRAYRAWCDMLKRCRNQNAKCYHNYGGRGIFVCDEWQDFRAFISDMGNPPDGLSLDRIDNDGPYCKSNCKWSTTKEQHRNTRRSRLLTFNGETMNMCDWDDRLGMSRGSVRHRLNNGWPIEKALSTRATKEGPDPSKTQCHKGHPFTVANTYRNPNGTRKCRACNRESVRQYKERKARML